MRTSRRSLIKRFIVLSISILLLVLFALMSQLISARSIMLERSSASLSSAHQQVHSSIEYFSSSVSSAAYALCYSPTIQQMLKGSSVNRVLMNDDVLSVFSGTSLLQDNIIGICIFDSSGAFITGNGQNVSQIYMDLNETASQPDGLFSSLSSDAEEKRLGKKTYTISYPVYSMQSNRLLGSLIGGVMFTMNTGNIQSFISGLETYDGAMAVLCDLDGNVVSASSPAAEELYLMGNWSDESLYLNISSTLAGSNWTLISILPKGMVQSELQPILWISTTSGAVIFLLLLCCVLLVYSKIFIPIRSLSEFMRRVPLTDGNIRYPLKNTNDELEVMAQSMNMMLDSLDEENKALRKSEMQYLEADIARQQMEILAYRNQINPHFLYNTLECIRGIALYHNAPEIARISQSLSKMFRYAVKGENFAMAADEVQHTREYANIIGYRFMNRIKIDFEIENDALSCRALKLTLQPLVENAVFHGLEGCVGDYGRIIVGVCVRRDMLYFTVTDNGMGMDPEKLDAVKAMLENAPGNHSGSEKSIGLSNIARRLSLFYMGQSNMHIESKPGEGTRVQISIPVQREPAQSEEADPKCTPQ